MRAKEMNFATLPCLRKVAISHPGRNFSSLMCLEECCELLQLAGPFIYQEPRREGKDRCMPRPGFLFTHLPTFSRFLLLFSPVPLEKDGLSVFRLCNEVTSSQDQAHFLLHRPKSGQECSSVQISWWFTCQGGWFCFLGDWEPSLPFLQTSTEYLTICKYYVSLWCTLCSCLFLNQNACLGGDKRI